MPPRRSARVAAVTERVSSALSPLPHAVVLDIFVRLPADERARAKLVSRGWLSTLSDVCLWMRLDLSRSSGVRVRVTNAVLRAAAGFARRAGGLTALDVSDCTGITHAAVLAVVTSNARSLRELRVCGELIGVSTTQAEALLRAAPLLRVFDAYLDADCADVDKVLRVLRNEAPFGALRVHHLKMSCSELVGALSAVVEELAAGLVSAAHSSLASLTLSYAPFDTLSTLDAVVDAALAQQLHTLKFSFCHMQAASVPSLARLLHGGTLRELSVLEASHRDPWLDAPGSALLCDALRTNSTLTSLTLNGPNLWGCAPAALALLAVLTGHPSLRALHFHNNKVGEHQAAAGAAVGALLATNALCELSVSGWSLGDAGMRPLVRALPHNTHLRTLNVSWNDISDAFARNELLPAVRANTSLRALIVHDPVGADARVHVAARAAADAVGAQ
jgi:hypothetical protein